MNVAPIPRAPNRMAPISLRPDTYKMLITPNHVNLIKIRFPTDFQVKIRLSYKYYEH